MSFALTNYFENKKEGTKEKNHSKMFRFLNHNISISLRFTCIVSPALPKGSLFSNFITLRFRCMLTLIRD